VPSFEPAIKTISEVFRKSQLRRRLSLTAQLLRVTVYKIILTPTATIQAAT